jgi:hypothetical protein
MSPSKQAVTSSSSNTIGEHGQQVSEYRPNKCSPAATSDPIPVPGCEIAANAITMERLPTARHRVKRPVHHRLDDITDYSLSGTNSWQFANKQRLEQAEREVGKIFAGQWTPVDTWSKNKVNRKDVKFDKEQYVAEGSEVVDENKRGKMKWQLKDIGQGFRY